MIVVGEALMDVAMGATGADGATALTAHAGGSPANVAVGLARLDVPTRFAGRISSGGFGPVLRAHLQRSGVDLQLCVDAPEPATLAIVGVDDDGVAAYAFYVEGTADWQWQVAELPECEPGAVIHTGSLAVALEPGASAIVRWITEQRDRHDIFVSLDPNVRPLVLGLPGYHERLDALIDQAQLIKVSDEDLAALVPGVAALDTAQAWAQRGPQLVVVTHGGDGSTALMGDAEPLHCAAPKVDVVDTIGAGDAFSAGLLGFLRERGVLHAGLAGTLDRSALRAALEFAGQVAAMTCARAGADPPTRAELTVGHQLSPG